jgi:hypothetical protein
VPVGGVGPGRARACANALRRQLKVGVVAARVRLAGMSRGLGEWQRGRGCDPPYGPHPQAIYFVGAMYPVTRAQVWDSGEKLVQVIVGSPFGPEKPGVSKKMVPSS